jgi:hypothetical protein
MSSGGVISSTSPRCQGTIDDLCGKRGVGFGTLTIGQLIDATNRPSRRKSNIAITKTMASRKSLTSRRGMVDKAVVNIPGVNTFITIAGGRFSMSDAHFISRLEPMQETSESRRSDALFRTRPGVLTMTEQPVIGFSGTVQTITARVLAESRRTYGATVDDMTLQTWVTSALSLLLTEQTRVTQFIPVLAMRDIRERASHYTPEAA